jgi:hypothetical protein
MRPDESPQPQRRASRAGGPSPSLSTPASGIGARKRSVNMGKIFSNKGKREEVPQERRTTYASPAGMRRARNTHSTVEVFSPFAASLGFQITKKWVDESDADATFSGALTDRTHGSLGRPSPDMIRVRPKKMDQSWQNEKSSMRKSMRQGRFGPYTPVSNIEMHVPPMPPAFKKDLPDFTGRWKCTMTIGPWDAYLTLCNVPEARIKVARGVQYGAGLSVQEIHMPPSKDFMTVVNMSVQVRPSR